MGFVIAVIWLFVYLKDKAFDNSLSHTPVKALGPADVPMLEQARTNWIIAQRSVRILEKLIEDPMTNCVIPEKTRKDIQKIVAEFYDS